MSTTDAVGVVAEAGPLGDLLLHDKPLAVHAWHALRDAGVEVLTADDSWDSVLARGLPLVVHDPACPLTPSAFIAAQIDQAVTLDRILIGSRPVTDTIKTVASGRVGATVDRDALLVVTAPVVLPVSALSLFGDWPGLSDVPALVTRLRTEALVDLVPAPALSRRVEDESAVQVLEAFAELQG